MVVIESAAETDRGKLAARIGEVLAGAGEPPLSGVLSLLALDEAPVAGWPVVPGGLAGTLALVQALGDAGIRAPLWVLTRGAVAARDGEPVASPVQAMAWGLGRVAGLEHPDRWGGLVDLPPAWDEKAAGRLCAVLAGGGEDQVAIRGAGVVARRLARAPRPRARARGGWAPRGTVLVTGATGEVGPYLARWLAERRAPRVVLVSRSGPAAGQVAARAAEVAGAGSPVAVLACDITERASLRALLPWLAASGPELSAVLHAAVSIELAPLDATGLAGLAAGLAAKTAGAAVLDELTSGLDLDAFVLFSSIAGVWGSGVHGAYAAANAYLDALASHRRGRGLPATSVAWGVWDTGDRGQGLMPDGVSMASLRRQGLRFLDPGRALAALDQVLAGDEPFAAVADVDWARFAPVYRAARPWPLLEEIPEAAAPAAPAEAAGGGEFAVRLAGRPGPERERVVLDLVRGCAAAVLGHGPAAAVEPGRAFRDLGFDSLTAVELRDRLGAATGLVLPSTVVFDYPTAMALARRLLGLLLGVAEAPSASVPPATVVVAGEPVAVVGLGCRYPGGVRDPEQLWALLTAGGDAISGFPADRGWDTEGLFDPDPDRAGSSYVREGGFLLDAADFDPGFFGISPREALAMDPQQRLLLEVCWEAIERAGIDPAALRGSATGVFAGATSSGYDGGLDGDEGHQLTGNATSVLSGRVSYTLGLEGPAVTLDTACSSSLVALHLACEALRSGECDLALAGGVAVMATPGEFVGFSRQRALAADGRCKAFGAGADGMGLSEGAGVVLLERLSDALSHGHPVLAVIKGSAVNQDGASNGLTAPNGPSQQRVIRAALAAARLAAVDVDAVEAHGTGTRLGDPIEAQALLATYGQDRDRPLWLGSVKSNIGHTQAAAGVAGLIKMVLALRHGTLPATLHAAEASPHVDWSAGDVRLVTEAVPWPAHGRPRRAGVSAFGISGTNAHVIVEEAPTAGETEPVLTPALAGGPVPWLVSARSAAALAAQAERLAEFALSRPELDPADVAWTLATARSSFEHRAVITADREELTAGLASLAAGQPGPGVVTGVAPPGGGTRVGFLFAGQGSQRAGMGRELHASSPVFAAAFDRACALLEAELGAPVAEVVLAQGDDERADQTLFAQAGLFAVGAGLVALLASCGITPDAVAGHSVGEVTAAYAAGVLSLADACRLVAARARLMQALPGGGAMTAIAATEAEVADAVQGVAGVSVAAVNGPSSVVISGDAGAVEQVCERFRARGIRVKALRVSHAFHSHRMDPVLDELGQVAAGLEFTAPRVPWACAVTGDLVTGPEPGYWPRQAREPVRFADAVAALAAQDVSVFVEIGPDGTLSALGPAVLGEDAGAVFVPLLRSGQPAPAALTTALARAHVHGIAVDWAAVLGAGRQVDLPTYAFARQRYWPQPAAVPASSDGWRYQITWAPVPVPDRAALSGTWLVVAPPGLAGAYVRLLESRGAQAAVQEVGPDELDRQVLAARLQEVSGIAGVLSLLALDETPLPGYPGVPGWASRDAVADPGTRRRRGCGAAVGADVRCGGGRSGRGAGPSGAGDGVGSGPGRGAGASGPVGWPDRHALGAG